MNKQQLVENIMTKTELPKKTAENFVNAFVETVSDALAEGDKVQLIGFGTFETRERGAREARNPQTGETLTVGAKRVPAFKVGKALKDAINK